MSHVTECVEDKALRRLWVQCAFRHPREHAGALLAAFYKNTRDMYIGTEGEGLCPTCQQAYVCRLPHAHIRCPNLWQNVIIGLGAIAHICEMHVSRGVSR